jgi:hypothetical protein
VDAVFDAQYRTMKDAFAAEGIQIEVAYTPAGDVDYVYQAGRLLAANDGNVLARLRQLLPGIQRVNDVAQDTLTLLSIEDLEGGSLTVPEALDVVDDALGDDNPALREGGLPLASPDHMLHISRICPAVEPEVPTGDPTEPWPPPCPAGESTREVFIGVSDTGLLDNLDPGRYTWLADVQGESDLLGPVLRNGLARIPHFTGHGTFIAGVARCMAPGARVFVNDHFSASGGELESRIIDKVEELARQGPDIINLSAGTYCRRNWTSLGFESFHQRHPDVTLVTAAGNDSTDRKFYPAAYSWTVSVGSLGPDQKHRAWFSNYGDWVNVYALGEGMVNAYATGEYVYREPPKRPARQIFTGMARWDGTSFSAPLVAGLIAARMSRTGESSADAAAAVLQAAGAQAVEGVGPVLFPSCDQP